jgi:hypothetical protein
MAAPAPAPKSPPDTARSPGVVPQADNMSAAASAADAEKVFGFIIAMFLPHIGFGLETGRTSNRSHFLKEWANLSFSLSFRPL